MTEPEWRRCSDLREKLVFLEGRFTGRKARLFTCAVGQYLRPFLGDERSWQAIETAERFADGLVGHADLIAAERMAIAARRGATSYIAQSATDHGPWQGARMAAICLQETKGILRTCSWSKGAIARAKLVLDCIFGNPFRPVSFDPAWREWNGGTVVMLARTIYDERRFDLMPLLGDALEDALCDNADMIEHCRGPGPHVRGCWVVDLILGKE